MSRVFCLRATVVRHLTCAYSYQAGESIYELFDKVMVIDKGRQVFFGPPNEARAYFEQLGFKPLPRQSTADYLTGCTDPNERQFSPGRSELDVPSSPEELEQAFLASHYAAALHDSLEKYKIQMETERHDQEAFREAVAADKKRGVSRKSPYTVGFIGQVKALTRRQFQMRLQDKFHLVTSYSLSWVRYCGVATLSCRTQLCLNQILAIIIGAAFFKQPATAAGAFTRGSVMFAALLTSCLDTFGEVCMPVASLLHRAN